MRGMRTMTVRNGALRLAGAAIGLGVAGAACTAPVVMHLMLSSQDMGGGAPRVIALVLLVIVVVLLAPGMLWLTSQADWQWRTKAVCWIATALRTGLVLTFEQTVISWRGERVTAEVTQVLRHPTGAP